MRVTSYTGSIYTSIETHYYNETDCTCSCYSINLTLTSVCHVINFLWRRLRMLSPKVHYSEVKLICTTSTCTLLYTVCVICKYTHPSQDTVGDILVNNIRIQLQLCTLGHLLYCPLRNGEQHITHDRDISDERLGSNKGENVTIMDHYG